MLERKWDRFFIQPQTNKVPKNPETYSIIFYESNVAGPLTIQRPPVT